MLKSESELLLSFLNITEGVTYNREGNKFVTTKVNNGIFEVHDAYSEEGMDSMVDYITRLFKESGCERAETYVDKDYEYFDRSHEMVTRGGMMPFKETEDYVYYYRLNDYE